MKRNLILIFGFLVLANGFVLNSTFVTDPILNLYYERNHYASELESSDPRIEKIRELVTAINNTYGWGGYETAIYCDGNFEQGCLSYGGYFYDETETYYYMFANCGEADFYLRSKEVARITGEIRLELKAGQARYFAMGDINTVRNKVTLRLLGSDSMFEFDTNSGGGTLLMPEPSE